MREFAHERNERKKGPKNIKYDKFECGSTTAG